MPVYKHLFFNGFCVIYFWVCFIFPRHLGKKLMCHKIGVHDKKDLQIEIRGTKSLGNSD